MAKRRGAGSSWKQGPFRRCVLFSIAAIALVAAGALGIDVPSRTGEGKDSATHATDQQSTAAVQQMKELTRRLIDRAYGRRESVSIDGQVTDEAGHAIRGATVGFGPYGLLPFQWNCETDEAGGFRLGFECGYMVPDNIGAARTRFRALGIPLPSQNLYTDGPTAVPADSIVVGAKGYAATRLPFARPPGSYSVAVRLRKGLTVRARVVDVEGRPIREAFAIFIARTPDSPKWIVQYRTDSDAEGRIEWSGACRRRWQSTPVSPSIGTVSATTVW